jgi:hypothetical protein
VVRFLAGTINLYLSQSVQTGYGTHNLEDYNLKNPLYKDNFTVIVTRPK